MECGGICPAHGFDGLCIRLLSSLSHKTCTQQLR
jgi:hypothetical protein